MIAFHNEDSFQWPFQEPKLEVPTIYKVYIRPMEGNIPTTYGLIWYSTSILRSWNSHWSLLQIWEDLHVRRNPSTSSKAGFCECSFHRFDFTTRLPDMLSDGDSSNDLLRFIYVVWTCLSIFLNIAFIPPPCPCQEPLPGLGRSVQPGQGCCYRLLLGIPGSCEKIHIYRWVSKVMAIWMGENDENHP